MPVFNDLLGNIYHTEGSRIVWSTTRGPALLFPSSAVTLGGFTVAYPDFSKDSAYGLDVTGGPFDNSGCATLASLNPQEWDSGLSFVCNVPAESNYIEVEVTFVRTFVPSTYMGQPFASSLIDGATHLLDGGACEIEKVGPAVRLLRFERSGNAIYMRRKQSVRNSGSMPFWAPGNSQTSISGGIQTGWTYTGNPNAWPAYVLDSKFGGAFAKRRGESNACSLVDTSNYASTYSGTITITPGYIKL